MGGFKKDDIVVIRDWDDMSNEYGHNSRTGSINCAFSFTELMKHMCGKIAIIKGTGVGKEVYLDFVDKEPGEDYSWAFSTDMIRMYDDGEEDNTSIDQELIDFMMW